MQFFTICNNRTNCFISLALITRVSEHTKDVENLLSNPKRALLTMSLPLLFALLVENIQSFVDGVWCSGLGSAAMSAISLATPVYGMVVAFGTGLGVGASAAIAKYIGAGDKGAADNVVLTTIVLTAVAALLLCTGMWFAAEPLIVFCGGGENVELCLEYCQPLIIMAFFLMMNAVWAGTLRAEGAAKVSMVLSIAASVLNMILDPLLIYGLNLGVFGAALATGFSYVIVSLAGFWWYLSGRSYVRLGIKGFHFRKTTLYEVCIVGLPVGFEIFLAPLISVPQNAIVYACGGEAGFVAFSYAFRFVAIALLPSMAIAKSLIPVISAAIGQKDGEKIVECCKITYKFTLKLEFCFMIFILLTADILVMAFMNSESMASIHDEMALALRIYSLTCIFHTFRIVGTSILQATRHAVATSILTFLREITFLGTFYVAGMISMTAIYWACDLTNFMFMFIISYFAIKAINKELHILDVHPEADHEADPVALHRPFRWHR